MPSGSMRSAIYYPHVTPHSRRVLRTALLLWDELEFIVPFKGFRPPHSSPEIEAAVEIIGHLREPTESDKQRAHARIEEFATGPLPDAFYYRDNDPGDGFGYMFAGKLLPETWNMLRELQLAGPNCRDTHGLRDAAGMALMSILTDCCAGETKARVTDREVSYAQLTDLLVDKSSSKGRDKDETRDAFVPVTLNLVDARSIPLHALVDLRRREASRSGTDLRRLRRRYRDRIEQQARMLSSIDRTEDAREIAYQFELEMAEDLADLRSELRIAKGETLTSKEVIITTIAAAGVTVGASAWNWTNLVTGAAAAAPLIGGLLNARLKYAKERRSIIARHPMAYMLEVGR